uniref:UBX domain-containing protein n=1 Tax=Ascaris lumbricoides TaxID=6252 RepID=A0A9J2P754_ASCLU
MKGEVTGGGDHIDRLCEFCLPREKELGMTSGYCNETTMSGVTVICPNSHRCTVKVTPSTLLRKVLEEACLKQGYDVDAHELKHQNRVLDVALPFRLTGLPNNATVEMTPISRITASSDVDIALQLPDGSRKLHRLSNELTLLDVLAVFSVEFGRDLIESDRGTLPVCAFMNKEYRGEAELSMTTLKSMGISSGRSLIRYSAQKVSEEELRRIEQRVAEEKARKEKLSVGFDARKAENQQRLEIERQREEEFAKQYQKNEEMAARRRVQPERSSTSSDRELSTATSSSTGRSEESSKLPTRSSTSDSTHTAVAAEHSATRLERLQLLLSDVNTSLSSNIGDLRAENLLTENGRIAVDSRAAPNSAAAQQEADKSANFRIVNTSSGPSEAEMRPSMDSRVCTTKCDRRVMIVRKDAQASQSAAPTPNIDDKFFELSVHDAQSLQKDLREEVRAYEQRALLPREFIAQRNRELKEAAYKHTVVRFQLPDKTTIQALFLSREPVSHIYEFIARNLHSSGKPFDLCFALNQRIPNDNKKTLIDADLAPSSTIFVRFHEKTDDYASLFSNAAFTEATHEEANNVSKEWLSTNAVYRRYDPRVNEESRASQVPAKRQSDEASHYSAPPTRRFPSPSATAPKWFKKM